MGEKHANKLNILFITEFFPNTVQPWFLNIVEQSILNGYHATIVAYKKLGSKQPAKFKKLNLKKNTYYYLAGSSSYVGFMFLRLLLFILTKPKFSLSIFVKLCKRKYSQNLSYLKLVKEILRVPVLNKKIDIIHAHHLISAYEYLFIKDLFDVPLVVTFHGQPPIGVPHLNQVQMLELFILSDVFLVNTNFAKRQLIHLGCVSEKIKVIPQGIELDEFKFLSTRNNKTFIFLTVGRIDKNKGHEYAIYAIRDLISKGIKIKYYIVGYGPYIDDLIDLVNELGLNEQVQFLGEVEGSRLSQYYLLADIFLFPSTSIDPGNLSVSHETQGVVVQEAQASGAIVIASSSGGIPECLDRDVSAFVFQDRNVSDLTETLLYVLNNSDKWEEWRLLARNWVEKNFDIRKIGNRLNEEVYLPLIASHSFGK